MLGRKEVGALFLVGVAGSVACGAARGDVEPAEVVIPPAGAPAEPASSARRVAAPRDTEPDAASRPLVWIESPETARAQATRERRPMLLFIRADWATASLEMERGALTEPRFERAARPYVLARLDATDGTQGNAYFWLQSFAVTKVPAIVLFDPVGRREVVEGAMSADELVDKLNQFLERP